MRSTKLLIFISQLFVIAFLSGCDLTRNVPKNKYLLKSNKIVCDNKQVSSDDLAAIIRQQPNQKTLGINFKLRLFNAIDSAKVAQSKDRKIQKFQNKIEEKRKEILKTNEKRIIRARKKGKVEYTEKVLRDTVFDNVLLRERFKYKFGQKPIVFDSIPFEKSIQQLGLYLRKSGYYYNKVEGSVSYNEKKRRAEATYTVSTGPQYVIDSVSIVGQKLIRDLYTRFLKKNYVANGEDPLKGKPFDINYLDDYRERVAKHMRDEMIYKFYANNIRFVVDTFKSTMKVNLVMRFEDKIIPSPNNPDSIIRVPFQATQINNVYFHLADSAYMKESLSAILRDKQLDDRDPRAPQFLRTLNTLEYAKLPYTPKKRKKLKVDKSVPDPYRIIEVTYNGDRPWLRPEILELQNYLEHTNKYKEYYLDRSYRSLNQLGVFGTIKPELVEIPGTNKLDVHYYLEATKKQSVGFEPRFTTSFGLLGVNASANYNNKNLFRGGEKLTISIGGGFESQPQVFEDNNRSRTFNTFEVGPSVKLDLPGLFPTPVTLLSKRQKPRTLISAAYNFEKRDIFDRRVFQLNYAWKFLVGKTQVFQLGLPMVSVIKFVNIQKSQGFTNQLNQINDPFLNATYSDQFIWQDFKLTWEYNNKDKDFNDVVKRFLNASIYFNTTLDAAGNTLFMFRGSQDTLNNQFLFNNLPYSQFIRFDNQYILSRKAGKKNSIHFKANAGAGIPYRNSRQLMPYDYSFFAGGSNDNRGWRARALGPGAYKYHLDTNRLITQIADIRIGASLEYRFPLGSTLRGAVFSDVGNIWTYREDQSRLGSQFKINEFYKQLAWSAGLGLRIDLDFFIVRLDVGFPIYNPALSKTAHWVFQDLFTRTSYYQEGMDYYNLPLEDVKKIMPRPFLPTINFGIGYPF
jgi:outer membrane protein insertion porin family